MEFESFYMEPTQGQVNHADGQVPKPSVLDDLLGVSSTSMDVLGVNQVVKDTDPLMLRKHHQHKTRKSSHTCPG